VQAVDSGHIVGQLPSQVSPGSTVPLPQVAAVGQSLSFMCVQPAGQQPSSLAQLVIAWWVQATLQFEALPVIRSSVQAWWSSQEVGQFPSQVSPGSTIPFPQLVEQSLSFCALQPAGQQ
jgi:hypothetical protein